MFFPSYKQAPPECMAQLWWLRWVFEILEHCWWFPGNLIYWWLNRLYWAVCSRLSCCHSPQCCCWLGEVKSGWDENQIHIILAAQPSSISHQDCTSCSAQKNWKDQGPYLRISYHALPAQFKFYLDYFMNQYCSSCSDRPIHHNCHLTSITN